MPKEGIGVQESADVEESNNEIRPCLDEGVETFVVNISK